MMRLPNVAALLGSLLLISTGDAHPSRSLAVRDDGIVIVPDAVRSVIWKFKPDGTTEALARGVHTHWLTFGPDGSVYAEHLTYDSADGSFAQSLVVISREGKQTTIVPPARGAAAFGSFFVRQDGAVLHAPESGTGRILARSPDGETAIFVQSSAALPFGHITAMAQGPTSTLNFSDERGVFEVDAIGRVSHRLEKLPAPTEPVKNPPPVGAGEIWGLASDDAGNVYVAEPYSRRVLKIAEKHAVSTAVTTDEPWFPTGLAWSGGRLYVVEHGLTGDKNLGPRVRILEADGTIRDLATITE